MAFVLRSSRPSVARPLAMIKKQVGRTACFSTYDSSGKRIALVVGSSGALGSTLSQYLSKELGMSVLGADVISKDDPSLDGFVPLPKKAEALSVTSVTTELALGVHNLLEETEELDTIVVASGGWAGDVQPVTGNGSIAEEIQTGAEEFGSIMDAMLYMNLVPVIAATYTAERFIGPNGLFVTIGATAALSSTPGMLGYGLTKAASHHIVQTVGATTGRSLESRGKQKAGRRYRQHAANLDTLSSIGILPTTIDTPNNRHFNPDASYDTWTKPMDIAMEIGKWVEMPQLRPHSGALVKVTTTEDGSVFDLVR